MEKLQIEADYERLRAELERLKGAPSPDTAAIDAVMDSLDRLQQRLKSLDGQPGNLPDDRRDLEG